MKHTERRWSGCVAAAGTLALAALAYAGSSGPLVAQDLNFSLPVDSIEALLAHGPLAFARIRDTRFPGDRTQRVDLAYGDSTFLSAKWAAAPTGGHQFNNAPRYELGGYALQKLFLADNALVVPPTVVRAVPLQTAQNVRATSSATFRGTASTLVVLQYWLPAVVPTDVWDPQRFQSDTAYARNVANLNVFTFLARHG